MSVSVLVLARNEEANLPRCLESVSWSDDIVVLDDSSIDRTADIAREKGARVVRHSAGNEREQRTYSLREIVFKHPWVYNPDADEVTPPDLRDEILRVISDNERPEMAYRLRFKNMFMGTWIRHSSLYPTWVMRLFRPEGIRFERSTNLTYVADGPVGYLRSHFLHYSFSKGLNSWREKHVCYAALEAKECLKNLNDGRVDWMGLVAVSDPVRRRRALKQLSFRLPWRPTLRFTYMYFLRMGFLDGWAGLEYCRLLAWYEHMIVENVELLRRHRTMLPSARKGQP